MYIKDVGRDISALWMEDDGCVVFIDQRSLPERLCFVETRFYEETGDAIREMVVRGAPAIGVAGAFGMAQAWLVRGKDEGMAGDVAEDLMGARPTAKDLFTAVSEMEEVWESGGDVFSAALRYRDRVVEECRLIGVYGADLIKDGFRVLTHCNAGALATVDWGTALAPVRMAYRSGKNVFVWVDETRPWLQGSRLTAWELVQEGVSHSVIADNAAGYYMAKGEVDVVIVGADRVTANGDVVNKIGTYEKALAAVDNHVPFYVAVPSTTLDFSLECGWDVVIEERDEAEVLDFAGKRVAPAESRGRNPVFDVTPARLITGYITPKGIVKDITGLSF